MYAATDTRAAEHSAWWRYSNPLDPVQLRRWEAKEPGQVPLALRDVPVFPPFAGLHHTTAVALLLGA
jgi:hypothetical protein